MKKLLITLLSFGLFAVASAQKLMPEIKVGTNLICNAYVQGQDFSLLLTIKSVDGPVSIGWAVDGYGEGTFEMSKKALDSGSKMVEVTQPALGTTKLADEETFYLISKMAYQSLVNKKSFTYSSISFKIKTPTTTAMKLGGKEIDATHVISEDGKIELWVLNNANLPLVLQTVGMPTDIVVTEIK